MIEYEHLNEVKNTKVKFKQDILVDESHDMEKQWREHKHGASSQVDELEILLTFLKTMCYNCFKPAQIFLRTQIDDMNLSSLITDRTVGKVSSIDLFDVVS